MGKRKPQKPFFYSEELSDGDKVLIGIYSFFTIAVLVIWLLGSVELIGKAFFFYTLVLQLGIIFGLYIFMRNFRAYLIWFAFGLLHLLIFIFSIAYKPLDYSFNTAIGLNTIVFLLLFQVLRYFSFKYQHREFVNPAKSYSLTGPSKDIFENKIVSSIDWILFFVYMAVFFGLTVLTAQM